MITLFVGGARSGKSELAERYVASLPGPVTYVATWMPAAGCPPDPDMDARIAAHRDRRPSDWGVREVGADLPDVLRALPGSVLLDALGTWVASAPDMTVDVDALCAAMVARPGDTVVVSDEVGLGVHPSSAVGGRFREVLGRLNVRVGAVADDAWLVVAGRVVPLARPAW